MKPSDKLEARKAELIEELHKASAYYREVDGTDRYDERLSAQAKVDAVTREIADVIFDYESAIRDELAPGLSTSEEVSQRIKELTFQLEDDEYKLGQLHARGKTWQAKEVKQAVDAARRQTAELRLAKNHLMLKEWTGRQAEVEARKATEADYRARAAEMEEHRCDGGQGACGNRPEAGRSDPDGG